MEAPNGTDLRLPFFMQSDNDWKLTEPATASSAAQNLAPAAASPISFALGTLALKPGTTHHFAHHFRHRHRDHTPDVSTQFGASKTEMGSKPCRRATGTCKSVTDMHKTPKFGNP
jgi:hypothetical protein